MHNLSEAVQEVLSKAVQQAMEFKHTEITEHLVLLEFLNEEGGYFNSIIESLGNVTDLKNKLELEVGKASKVVEGTATPRPSYTLGKILTASNVFAKEIGDEFVSADHMLYAFFQEAGEPLFSWKNKNKINQKDLKEKILKLRNGSKMDSPTADKNIKCLEKYCKNLTDFAKQGKLDPVIGRDEEIRRTIQVLSRRTKNNPILIGDPGVGKTAIAEGLALRITQNDVPDGLKGRMLLSLDMGSLIAGAKFRGEFEERLKGVLEAIEKSEGQYILFIDEVHVLVGAGASEGAMDAANLLKPALARGALHCIGATTITEYRKYIEKDAALERRFQPVMVEEPTLEDAVSILRGLRDRYEIYHGVRITEAALNAAVFLSNRYIKDRFLPDKAIDLIDEAASLIRMQLDSLPLPIDEKERELSILIVKQEALRRENIATSKQAIDELEKQIQAKKEELKDLRAIWENEKELIDNLKSKKNELEKLRFREEEAERNSDYNTVAELRYSKIPALEEDIKTSQHNLEQKKDRLLQEEVDENLISTIVSKWSGIPVTKMLETDTTKLLKLEESISEAVIGQKNAISAVSDAIRSSRSGLSDPNRPMGVFLFVGPTGVGKTALAKALTNILFDKEDAIIRLDMSEYMEKHSVSKLIGSPPGYVGYEEGGVLSEALRRAPYSVVLFDEIEKAHPEVCNILLQVFDDGRITDSKGRTVNCRNALFIMTSNLGSDLLMKDVEKCNGEISAEKALKTITPEIQKHFKPEFINRVDEVLPFVPLSEEDIELIAAIQLKEVASRLLEKYISFTWNDQSLQVVANKGYDPVFGARPIKRIIRHEIVNQLSKAIIKGDIKSGDNVVLIVDKKDNFEFTIN